MRPKPAILKYLGGIFVLFLICSSKPVQSATSQRETVDSHYCHAVTRKVEYSNGMPADLLTSISLAETGRWDPKRKRMFAWPWTVTWNGKGRYFPSKTQAIQTVKSLKSAGIKNIDVGCMQINLYYHPNAFRTIEEAFNPETNVNYAGRFLTGLYKSTGSWIQAAANYHSTSPLLNLNYQTKLLKIWRKVSGVSLNNLLSPPNQSSVYKNPTSREAQLALLNSRFRARLQAERNNRQRSKSNVQLNTWRKNRFSPNLLSITAAKNKALQKRKEKSNLANDKASFAKKRLEQLAKWRKDRYFFRR